MAKYKGSILKIHTEMWISNNSLRNKLAFIVIVVIKALNVLGVRTCQNLNTGIVVVNDL